MTCIRCDTDITQPHIGRIQLIARLGYSVSFVSLVIAFSILRLNKYVHSSLYPLGYSKCQLSLVSYIFQDTECKLHLPSLFSSKIYRETLTHFVQILLHACRGSNSTQHEAKQYHIILYDTFRGRHVMSKSIPGLSPLTLYFI